MSDQHRSSDPGRADPVRTTHELLNVLAAARVHLFMARGMFPAGEPVEPADDTEAAPRTPAELLARLEAMVDRALGLAEDLNEQVRTLDPR